MQEAQLKAKMASTHKKAGAHASFFSLLPASKQQRVEQYKKLPKIDSWLADGKEVASWMSWLAQLWKA